MRNMTPRLEYYSYFRSFRDTRRALSLRPPCLPLLFHPPLSPEIHLCPHIQIFFIYSLYSVICHSSPTTFIKSCYHPRLRRSCGCSSSPVCAHVDLERCCTSWRPFFPSPRDEAQLSSCHSTIDEGSTSTVELYLSL